MFSGFAVFFYGRMGALMHQSYAQSRYLIMVSKQLMPADVLAG